MSETPTPRQERTPTKRAPFAEVVSSIRHQITDHPKRNIAFVAGAASITAGMYGLSTNNQGGNEHLPPNTELISSSHILRLDEGATLRFDPIPKDDADNHNGVLFLEDQLDVISVGYITGTDNGIWYAVTPDSLRDALAGSQPEEKVDEIRSDKDNLIWVNEQGVADVAPLEDDEVAE